MCNSGGGDNPFDLTAVWDDIQQTVAKNSNVTATYSGTPITYTSYLNDTLSSGVYCPDGCVYYSATNSAYAGKLLKLDTVDDSLTVIDTGYSIYDGALLYLPNKLYWISDTKTLVYDFQEQNYSFYDGVGIGSVSIFTNGVNIYGNYPTWQSGSAYKYNVANNSVTTLGSISTSHQSWGTIDQYGNVYVLPTTNSKFYKIDTSADTLTQLNVTTNANTRGGAVGVDGNIYIAPYAGSSCYCYNPQTNSVTTFGSVSGNAGSYLPAFGKLTPTGEIFCYSFSISSKYGLLMTTSGDAEKILLNNTYGVNSCGCVLTPAGIYSIPFSEKSIMKTVIGGGVVNFKKSTYLSPILNHY